MGELDNLLVLSSAEFPHLILEIQGSGCAVCLFLPISLVFPHVLLLTFYSLPRDIHVPLQVLHTTSVWSLFFTLSPFAVVAETPTHLISRGPPTPACAYMWRERPLWGQAEKPLVLSREVSRATKALWEFLPHPWGSRGFLPFWLPVAAVLLLRLLC